MTGEVDGDTITFRRFYRHRIEHVWDAIATEAGLRGWLMATHVAIGADTIELVSGPPGYRSTGKILRREPPRVFEYEWNVAPVREMPHGERAIFRYELAPDGDGTRLVVTIRKLTRTTIAGFLPGQHAFLDRLAAQLDGEPMPDWFERFAAHRPEYPAWQHATDPAQ